MTSLEFSGFLREFNADLYNFTLSAFKAARIMCPEAALRPTPATAKGLRLFPFLDSNHVINGLITELPNYVAERFEQENKVIV